MDGNGLLHVTGVDGAPGTNPGTPYTVSFVAGGSSMQLALSQFSGTEASPIIDNIVISAVPEPATWGMMIAGFGLVGGVMRRRAGKQAAAARLA